MRRCFPNPLLIAVIAAFDVPGGQTHTYAQSNPKAQLGAGGAYEIIDSEVWDVPDPVSGRIYQVFVALPPFYVKEPRRRYPVLYF
ncbi:hypothetical protein EN41_04805 [Agrobacterium tumefaciens]|jgi:hypothetical protein|nr:hypothetical protein EN41_04805 [Agrobacterium tumefaciens]WJK78104.1 hypothetical protein QOV31_004988 [Agrobacterium fabrum]CAD0217085.1 hypothetical protein AGTUEHA105_LOCUS5014 [Agrobacterium tumefaciens]